MAEVGIANGTLYLGSHHTVAGVTNVFDHILADRRKKTRPARARIKLGFGLKQWLVAVYTPKLTMTVLVIKRTGEGAFGAFLPGDGKLFGRQDFLPFGFRFLYPTRWLTAF